MFKWKHEYHAEVDVPLQKAWDFYVQPSNWPKWIDEFESCQYEGELKTGELVKLKAKNKNIYVPVVVGELKPYKELSIFIKVPFFSQASFSAFEKISNEKTSITFKTTVNSIFTLFMKSYLSQKVENQYLNLLNSLRCSVTN